jgi:hypothetical protein
MEVTACRQEGGDRGAAKREVTGAQPGEVTWRNQERGQGGN